MEFTHLDLFSGIGGFALAARWAGIKTVQFVEIDKFCQQVLRKNFPGIPIHDDIKTFTNTDRNGLQEPWAKQQTSGDRQLFQDRPFLLTGGFPCQPFSCAGKRRGKEDDRYLWEEMLRVIKEFKPRWIIGENVAGINSLFQYDSFSEMEGKEYLTPEDAKADFKGISERTGTNSLWVVLDDLEKIGYSVQTCIIPACAVGAPHRRDRVWIVAYSVSRSSEISNSGTVDCENGETQKCRKTDIQDSSAYRNCHAPDTARELSHGSREPRGRRGELADKSCSLADTSNQGLPGREWPGPHEQGQATHGSTSERNHTWDEPWIEVATRLCRVDARVSNRVDRLKALGNAIVPQVAFEIMKAILKVSDG